MVCAVGREDFVGENGGRKPQARRSAHAEEYHDDHDVVSSESVGQVSRCPTADGRGAVVDGDDLVGKVGTEGA